jgi:hypothetical protein
MHEKVLLFICIFFDAQFLDAAVFDAEICRVSWDKFEA